MRKWGKHGGRLPSLNYLIALEATARLGSFRAAADEMAVTQGAVAQQIRALEAELGCLLFVRAPRGLVATEAGGRFADRARLALEMLDAATAELLHDRKKADREQLVISVAPSFASRWLIPRLHRFSQDYPSVPVMIDASDQLRPLHGNGRVDVAIRWGRPPFPGATARFLLPGRAIPICAPSLTGRDSWLEPGHLEDAPLISDSHRLWRRWFDVYGRTGARIAGPSFSQTSHAIDAAEQGLGIALVPGFLVDAALKDGRLVRVLGKRYELETDLAFYVLTADRPAPSVTVEAMVDWLLLEAVE